MATIIGFISQKGGVGKSTLTRALAREAAAHGLKVKIADLDTLQGTVVDWNRKRLEADIQPCISVESFKTAKQALQSASGCDLLIIDGPARASRGTLEIAQNCDLLVQPTSASDDDLRPGVRIFHELVKAKIPRKKLLFALNRISTEAEKRMTQDYIEQAGYEVLNQCLFEKPAYRRAQDRGYSVTETSYHTVNQLADGLVQELVDRIS